MLKITDYYEFILYGEDFDSLATPEEYKEIILKFRQYENDFKNKNEWEIAMETGLTVFNIRRLRKTFCLVNGLTIPKSQHIKIALKCKH